ncbi:Uu.00g123460.m01.CDS01 [Anthostomella pinea]|uniref:Uu.00g123460.m01.CDS01 n=1 Tax=Anthostomella pinea TaxID=933095 RepID=A0AAI8YHM6_9PEZI|nr:Uu.00g123460.m01.CDS01 [Anthostomella pinea]
MHAPAVLTILGLLSLGSFACPVLEDLDNTGTQLQGSPSVFELEARAQSCKPPSQADTVAFAAVFAEIQGHLQQSPLRINTLGTESSSSNNSSTEITINAAADREVTEIAAILSEVQDHMKQSRLRISAVGTRGSNNSSETTDIDITVNVVESFGT